ncbi:hypothetical protein M8J71_23215 [Pseudarthrobacter sp. R1]|uniref:hypothetical protein n=1 Tax=Pseudarthrobacter sp. R1 TaxID=2944934 RepID=UPI0021089FE9|nr:hypothetical protein [Pseudarthrobacter sp. R1]MCQ6273356.1 hypothetical protein [Pseudarthrobacter sp. R1]
MSATHFDDFIRDAINSDPGSDKGLSSEELFGLYTSWCLLTECPSESADSLWRALIGRGIIPGKNALAMTGPAAADYILSSAPGLV